MPPHSALKPMIGCTYPYPYGGSVDSFSSTDTTALQKSRHETQSQVQTIQKRSYIPSRLRKIYDCIKTPTPPLPSSEANEALVTLRAQNEERTRVMQEAQANLVKHFEEAAHYQESAGFLTEINERYQKAKNTELILPFEIRLSEKTEPAFVHSISMEKLRIAATLFINMLPQVDRMSDENGHKCINS
ncbi:hypothetical protein BJ085DRAFT_38237 [Dimargaris cristalligena]|uniref:Uncharacterized protein n=1 Tax=Dimargaris cristalligena TaxID=215637 RepID=A0A4P9ZSH2_9FUNG|nr:hypothetical protein BJ085DRAFT_38237 [Dimargaris cristalligena]|eukprot:RKP36377.1 hypothetical protein BJ085DRAFT_38237 [Dimargaris cristalligena]